MRIWSIHPKYLDSKGLVALWRETLLAKNVLEGKTKGYINHPQLNRFKKAESSFDAINKYLNTVFEEAVSRHFNFDINKFTKINTRLNLTVTQGQIDYEFKHLLAKLKNRDVRLYIKLKGVKKISPNPMFKIIEGGIEDWEKVIRHRRSEK
ncbi:MAG: hypothetical protein HGB12_03535 [Bacteroidetes bacterium]|nr:hypothetical protein [Bacteroidota bacterium]